MKVTRKDVQGFKVLKVGYCKMQNLLKYSGGNKVGYNSGVYGWNYDLYKFGLNIAITTGYRPIGQSVKNATTIIYKHEAKAREINNDNSLSYIEKEKQVKNLLKNCVMELIANYK